MHLVGAETVSINLNGNSLLNLTVNKGVLDALVKNSGSIQADGGEVYLTTNAVDELLKGVVNNTGIIEAKSLEDAKGKIVLFAHGGSAHVDGTLDASGGFIETSGKSLHVEDSTIIKTKTWLIDPDNIIIESSGGAVGGESVSATAIQNALSTADIELQAVYDITVNEAITWATATQLKLTAGDEIYVNATIENTNTTNGGVYFNANNTTTKVIFDANGKVIIHNPYQLQWINQALNGKYELGSNVNAAVTSTWNSGAGFVPIGNNTNRFNGSFDGKGYAVDALTINRSDTDYVGLFGRTNIGTTIQNIGLTNVAITGGNYVGGLVGRNDGTLTGIYTIGTVSGAADVGGLVGQNSGSATITNAYAIGTVSGAVDVGGLVGENSATISNAYATGTVSGSISIGGLVGWNTATITASFWDTTTSGTGTGVGLGDLGGATGKTTAQMQDPLLYATAGWSTSVWAYGSGVEGYGIGLAYLKDVTAVADRPTHTTLFAGGFGTDANPYTITNWTQLQNINYNTNVLTNGYFFALSNNLHSATTGYTTLASASANSGAGWNPIGNDAHSFRGRFDGQGYTIDALTINRLGTDYVGLFGRTHTSSEIKNLGVTNVAIAGGSSVGGLVGYSYGATVANSYVSGNISGISFVGGLTGRSYQGSITNAYATSSVAGTGDKIGGLVGSNWQTDITNTYATGSVSGTGSDVGGLVGFSHEGSITASFWNTQTSGQATSAGGTGKTTAQMKDSATFSGWDILLDNTLNPNYPTLRMASSGPVWVIGTKSGGSTPTPPAPDVSHIQNGTAILVSTTFVQQMRQRPQAFAPVMGAGGPLPSWGSGHVAIINGGVRLPDYVDQEEEQ